MLRRMPNIEKVVNSGEKMNEAIELQKNFALDECEKQGKSAKEQITDFAIGLNKQSSS